MNLFEGTQRTQYTCDLGYNMAKAAVRIRVAEKVRAILDGDKTLQTEETTIVGGVNAVRFASELGKEAVKCETLVEVSTFPSGYRRAEALDS